MIAVRRHATLARAVTAAMLSLASASASAAPAERPPNPALKRRAFAKLRDIIKQEPTVKEVQQSALRFYKLEPERLEAMTRASRWKGLVPEIETGMDNSLGHTYTNTKDGLYPILPNTPDNPNPDFYKERVLSTTDQLLWRVRAVWQLDRLVFNSEALDVKSLNSIQENLVREVTTMFFSRRRLLANLILSPPEDEEELFYETLKLDEMTSTLDALTGGMFGSRAWRGEFTPGEPKPPPPREQNGREAPGREGPPQ
jgi:hypothetical protein